MSSPVKVIDGIVPVILNVPRKTREAHTDVTPWNLQQHETFHATFTFKTGLTF